MQFSAVKDVKSNKFFPFSHIINGCSERSCFCASKACWDSLAPVILQLLQMHLLQHRSYSVILSFTDIKRA